MTKDVPDYALMLGNPAKVAGWMCECGHQIDLQDEIPICNYCGKQYSSIGEEVKHVEHG